MKHFLLISDHNTTP